MHAWQRSNRGTLPPFFLSHPMRDSKPEFPPRLVEGGLCIVMEVPLFLRAILR